MNFSYGGLEMLRQVYQGSVSTNTCSATITTNCLLSKTITCYNGMTPVSSCPTAELYVSGAPSEITKYTSLNGGPNSEVDTLINPYGLVTETDEYDFGASTPTRKTSITYANIGGGVQDRPAVVKVTDGAGNKLSETDYSYDQDVSSLQSSGAPQLFPPTCSSGTCRGNLTTLTKIVSAGTSLSQTFTHYDTGQIYTASDVNNAVTTYVYGLCGNSLLSSVSEPLSLSKSFTWNCTGGVMTSSKDENGNNSYTNYANDPYFWRPDSTQDAAGNLTTLTYTGATRVESVLPIVSGSSNVDVATTVDSLGRSSLVQQRQAPGSSNFDTSYRTYDSDGRPYHSFMPCAAALGAGCSTPSTTTSYDAMGRPTQLKDGSTAVVETVSYNQNDIYLDVAAPSAENDKRKQFEYDALGRLTSVCEVTSIANGGYTCAQTNSKTGYWTRYKYDAMDRLIGVCQNTTQPLTVDCVQTPSAAQQTRTYTYDMLGRMTSETNPESGLKTYWYDTANLCNGGRLSTFYGDLIMTSDATGNCVTYYYDALHRVTDIGNNQQGVTSPCRRFRYDNEPGYNSSTSPAALTNTMGRLREAATDTCNTNETILTNEWFSYEARGPVNDFYESSPNSGGYYRSHTSYFANYLPSSHGLLSGTSTALTPTINYGLDGEGRPNSVSGSSGQSPVSAVNYVTANGTGQPVGVLTSVTFGSQDSDTFQYDPNTGRMTQYSFNVNGQSDVGTLQWNTNGTLKQLAITDPFNSLDNQTCGYAYDDLARVAGVSCGSTWWQTFAYDVFGNISKSGSDSWLPNYNNPQNQYVQGWNNVSYDPSGNLRDDTFNMYTWDVYGQMVSVNSIPITYDALGRMVEGGSGSTLQQYMYAAEGGQPLATGHSQVLNGMYLPLPGGAIAMIGGGGPGQYNHPDWLGSARLFSTPSRGVIPAMAYAPFGEGYATNAQVSQWVQFTSAGDAWTVDDNNNQGGSLEDFMFRRYSPGQGRWISPDPAGISAVNAANPQTWNRYAYVGNNPLSFTDPTGLGGPTGVACRNSWNANSANCVRYSANCMQAAGFCPPTPLNGTALDLLTSGIPIVTQNSVYIDGVWQNQGSVFDLTASIGAYHPTVGECLWQAAVDAGEDLLGISMIPGTNQDNWQWSSAKLGFVYTGAGEDALLTASNGATVMETATDFVTENPAAQGEIRQLLRNQGVKISMKHIAKDAALLGKVAGAVGKVLAAKTAYDRYQKCQGN